MSATTTSLHRLSRTNLRLADPVQDVRGRLVLDGDGQQVGIVDDLLIDDHDRHVRFLRVHSGGVLGIGRDVFLIPVQAIARVEADTVHLGRSSADIAGSPPYDPDLVEQPDAASLAGYWGYAPYWMAPTLPPYPFP
jgi:sporulation protein YlmC with PRC-barrel domain